MVKMESIKKKMAILKEERDDAKERYDECEADKKRLESEITEVSIMKATAAFEY